MFFYTAFVDKKEQRLKMLKFTKVYELRSKQRTIQEIFQLPDPNIYSVIYGRGEQEWGEPQPPTVATLLFYHSCIYPQVVLHPDTRWRYPLMYHPRMMLRVAPTCLRSLSNRWRWLAALDSLAN